MESKLITYLILAVVGFATGVFYFQGLWWTLKGLTVEESWTSRFLVSFLLRASCVVAVFYLFMAGDWRRVFSLTLGFLMARFLVVRKIKRIPKEEITEQM